MAIPLGEQYTPGHPVVKRTAIGQTFTGALVNLERRNRTKRADDGSTVTLTRGDGKPRQELVITCLAISGDAPAGIGDEQGIPEPGDTVRLILKGKSFADWITAEKALGRQVQVGDTVKQRTTSAQVYDANGDAKGDLLTEQAQVDAVPRSSTVGIYGDLKLEPGDGEWIDKAEAAYRAATATTLTVTPAAEPVEEPW
jgi:hypothetical protein